MSTGPTGESVDQPPNTGMTGSTLADYNMIMNPPMPVPVETSGPTGVDPSIMAMFPNAATGPTEPQTIVTLDELLASRETVLVKEANDLCNLCAFLNPTRETFRAPLFRWAAGGFEGGFTVSTIVIDPPPICSDGVSRSIGGYVIHCTGKSMEEITANIQSMMTGIQVFHSFQNKEIRIHVAKA